jgi:hypothetical protein
VFEKNANFFAKYWEKSLEIVIDPWLGMAKMCRLPEE